GVEGAGVVLDVKPVADVVALAIDWNGLPVERLQYRKWDQLLRKMVRSVAVRGVAQHCWQAKRLPPRPDQVIGSSLRRRIWRVRFVRRRFGELADSSKRPENLVGSRRDENEIERRDRPEATANGRALPLAA